MKKLFLILFLILLLCSFFSTAYANAPAPSPYDNYILIDDYSNITFLEIYGYDLEGNYTQIDYNRKPEETKVPDERIFYFLNEDGAFKSFQLVYISNGETIKSNFVDIVDNGSYIYSTNNNTLKQGLITSWKTSGFTIFFSGILLIIPLLVTIVVEWAISVPFKLSPSKYVVYINIATNLIMNILILIIYANILINYLTLIIIMEITVCIVEYLFYLRKYSSIKKLKVLSFVVVANTSSWLLYWLVGSEFLK